MVNPLPRTSSLLANIVVSKDTKQRAAEIDVGLNHKEDQRVNQIVAQVLESSNDEELERPVAISVPEEGRDSTRSESPDEETVQSTGPFVLPPAESSGLYDRSITLDDSQVEAVESLADVQYGCLIGAAGTGKTTVTKYLIHQLIYESGFEVKKLKGNQGLNIALVAFTGMAVQVMKSSQPDWMQVCCKTIHSLLEFSPEEIENKHGITTRIFVPQRHNLNKLDIEILIVDEASMVGLDLWKQLLAALKPGTRIYMIGDLNQLPPIIGQPIFAFALSSWKVAELTKVHRQKEAGANRIVEVAHQVLNGVYPIFDEQKNNPAWRVIFSKLEADSTKAHKQILNILNQIRQRPVDPNDPESGPIYDPYRDRVMTAGNGYDENVTSAFVQQAPLNEALSIQIRPPNEDHPRYIIDAGRQQKKFAVELRVMATKNEPPDKLHRVTNGMTGIIQNIVRNPHYRGKYDLFGIEADVIAATRERLFGKGQTADDIMSEISNFSLDEDEELDNVEETEEESEGGGAASHVVHVRFDNGAVRAFNSKAGVESLQLAYCSTVAKCQGSQFDCAVIIVHHAQKAQLSREWLYTAITRATKRVIILGTDYALRYAIGRQKIHGKTLAEKVERYRALANEGMDTGFGKVRMNVPLTIEDYDGQRAVYDYSFNQ